MKKRKSFVEIKNAGGRLEYAEILKRIQKDGVCPFCPKNFVYHTKPILFEGKHWLVTENFMPYAGTRAHLLFLHKKHVENVDKVSPAAWQELLIHIKKVQKKFKIAGGAFFIRFGDKRYNGASVTQHLHAQMVVGVKESLATEPLRVVLGHKKK